MGNTIKNIYYFKVGDTFTIEIDENNTPIKNLGPGLATNVVVTLTLSTGISLTPGGSTVSQGVFDDVTGIWTVGGLLPDQCLEASFSFTVDDDCELPYQIDIDTTSDQCNCNIDDNDICIIVKGVSCCEIKECVTDETIYEIPDTAFLDPKNPTLDEVKTWANANVPTEEQNNGTIISYTELAYSEYNVYKDITISFTRCGVAGNSLDTITINGTDYTQAGGFDTETSAAFDEAAVKGFIEAALTSEGVTGTVVVTDDITGTSTVTVDITTQTGITDIKLIADDLSEYTTDLLTYHVANNRGRKSPSHLWTLNKTGVGTYDPVLSFLAENNGNILYVSKSRGDNSLAEFGDPTRPWSDPLIAIRDALAGDRIHVLDGVWTFGSTGSGADLEVDKENEAYFLKDQVDQYWELGSGITNIQSVFDNYSIFRHYTDEDITVRIFGKGTFISSNNILVWITGSATKDVDFTFNADYVEYSVLGIRPDVVNSFVLNTNVRKVKAVATATSGALAYVYIGSVYPGGTATDYTPNPEVNINLGEYEIDMPSTILDSDLRGIVCIRNVDNGRFNINVGSVYGVATGNSILMGANAYGHFISNNVTVMNVDSISLQHPGIAEAVFVDYIVDDTTVVSNATGTDANKLPNLLMSYWQAGSADSHNNKYVLNIGDLKGTVPCGILFNFLDGGGFTSTNDSIVVNIKNAYMTNNCPVFAVNAFGGSDRHVVLNVENGIVEKGSAVFVEQSTTGSFTILKGNYKTNGAGNNVIYLKDTAGVASGYVMIQNAKLINDGTVAALENGDTGVAKDILIQNVVTNVPSGSADGDVNEVGQFIVRNTNYI